MDCSHCSTGLFELSILVLRLPSPDDVILARSEIHKTDGDRQNIKVVAIPILCNAYVQLKLSWNVCMRRIYLGWTWKGANVYKMYL